MLPFALLVAALGTGCRATTVEKVRATLHHLDLPELGVTLLLPGFWNITYSDRSFYQVVASGIGPNGSPSTFEFRSLPNRIRDTSAKVLFANGWYQSARDNYPTWVFIKRSQVAGDVEGTFEFDGRFENSGVTFRRLGKLRFREERVHAIYYTTHDRDASTALEYFEIVDSQHKFYRPSREGAGSLPPVLGFGTVGGESR